MTLTLHVNAHPVEWDELCSLTTPEPTDTHVPIAHSRVVDHVKYALKMYDHDVTEQHFGVTADGMRFFGLLSLRSTYGGYEDTVGLRNSHDKSFPIGIGFGSRVFVCDNLAFIADRVVKRKHTVHLKRDLPGLIVEMIEPLSVFRKTQHDKIELYKSITLSNLMRDHMVLELYRSGVVNLQRIPEVLDNYNKPPFDWDGGNNTIWSLFNAVTYTLSGRITERPDLTPQLHRMMDEWAQT